MKSQDQQVAAIVRSMKKCLKSEHNISIPFTALRAAYLQAGGINPHAFRGTSTPPVSGSASFADSHVFGRVFYLVEDDVGCLGRLALDKEGEYCVPDTWVFTAAAVTYLYATIPSVTKYGLPDYLVKTSNFFPSRFPNLNLAGDVKFDYHNTGDDTGDSAVLAISMTDDEYRSLLYAIAAEEDFLDEVEFEVGLHYKINFRTASNQHELVERHMLNSNVIAPISGVVDCEVEWVYEDEDSDKVPATVDLSTGQISFKVEPKEDLRDQRLRVRVMAYDYPFELCRSKRFGWAVPFSSAYEYGLVELRQFAGQNEA